MTTTRVSLRTTIVITITLVMSFTVFLVSFVVLTMTRKNMLDQKSRMGESIVKSLHHRIVSDCAPTHQEDFPFDRGLVQSTIVSYSQFFLTEELRLLDPTFIIHASAHPGELGKKINDSMIEQVFLSGKMLKEFRNHKGKKHLFIAVPLFYENKIEGALQAILSLRDIEESMAFFQKVVLLFTLTTALAFTTLGSILLTRYLVKPLEKLISITEEISAGILPHYPESAVRNEIGTLSSSLFKMANKLREDRRNIEEYIHTLEETNAQLKKAQEEVLHSEKLASVGKLAAGIAHEIGNPIGIILGYLDILRTYLRFHPESQDILSRIENEIGRIDTTIKELLDFSRPSKMLLQPIHLNPLIEEVVSLISHQRGTNSITIETSLQKELPPILGNEQQFQQVMINLLINALEATPQGGTVSVTSSCISSPDSPPGAIKITVRDTGVGIKKEELNKIFEPFYTTKPKGKGTGLGLSVSMRIIESFGGTITVESSPGKGTEFIITLPPLSSLQPLPHE